MTLKEKENELFERWRNSINATEDQFAKDGVADEERFINAKHKILFLAKETNDTGKNWDTRKYLREGVFYKTTQYIKDKHRNDKIYKNGKRRKSQTAGQPITKTFNNIYRWANLFLNDLQEYKDFNKAPRNKESRIKIFSQIGMMNLKKTTGTHTTDNNEFKKFRESDNNKKFINEQISLYKSDIIICCGEGVYSGYKKAIGDIVEENENGKFKTCKYIGDDYETVVIEFYHPQARREGADIKNHFNLLKNIKEQYDL